MQICIFPRVSRRCIMTAAGPQERGGVSHLRRDHVRARGRPDGSTALQHARRTNVQIWTINVLLYMFTKCMFRIKSPLFNGCIIICETVVTLSTVSTWVYLSRHIQLGSGCGQLDYYTSSSCGSLLHKLQFVVVLLVTVFLQRSSAKREGASIRIWLSMVSQKSNYLCNPDTCHMLLVGGWAYLLAGCFW